MVLALQQRAFSKPTYEAQTGEEAYEIQTPSYSWRNNLICFFALLDSVSVAAESAGCYTRCIAAMALHLHLRVEQETGISCNLIAFRCFPIACRSALWIINRLQIFVSRLIKCLNYLGNQSTLKVGLWQVMMEEPPPMHPLIPKICPLWRIGR